MYLEQSAFLGDRAANKEPRLVYATVAQVMPGHAYAFFKESHRIDRENMVYENCRRLILDVPAAVGDPERAAACNNTMAVIDRTRVPDSRRPSMPRITSYGGTWRICSSSRSRSSERKWRSSALGSGKIDSRPRPAAVQTSWAVSSARPSRSGGHGVRRLRGVVHGRRWRVSRSARDVGGSRLRLRRESGRAASNDDSNDCAYDAARVRLRCRTRLL
jgi:hypothetical protein